MNNALLEKIKSDPRPILIRAAKNKFLNFARWIDPDMELTNFHKMYYEVLDMFAKGLIKRLIITVPPQHGKSEGSTRKLPAFLFGRNPDLKISVGSYSTTFAQSFNTDIQKIIDSDKYRSVFPDTTLAGSGEKRNTTNWKRNTDIFEIVGRKGFLRTIGRGGALTGVPIDISILDDVYKDYAEGNSPVVRNKAWKWYTSVIRKRLHNGSQELIVFTRWHEDDLIGRIEKSETVIEIKSLSEIEAINPRHWVKINFQALKTGEKTDLDPRDKGVALWPNKHSASKLEENRKLDPIMFECLDQGNPASSEGLLYRKFRTYFDKSEFGVLTGKRNYTDVADEGSDYLCSICYDVYSMRDESGKQINHCLVTDIVYTNKPNEETLLTVPAMLNEQGTKTAFIESNNGGRGFAIGVKRETKCIIDSFYQSGNKESRVTTNAAYVNKHIIMPIGWESKFIDFHSCVANFKRDFEANEHDDAPDTLTGIIEKEIIQENKSKVSPQKPTKHRYESGVSRES